MADIKLSLISFDGISEVARLLIEKISKAVGWVANKETNRKIAESTYIEEIKNSDFDPITKACLITTAKKTINEYSRQHAIVRNAIDNMREDAKPNELDDDWILQFMDKARLVSDAEFQMIWGKLLAEECNAPGSIPRGLLHTLERMDRTDAEHFSKLCSFSVHHNSGTPEYSPIIVSNRFDDYYTKKKGLNYSTIVDLSSLGLIEASFGPFAAGYQMDFSTRPVTVCYHDKHTLFSESIRRIPIGNVMFTKTGQALCKAIDAEKQDDFWEEICLPLWNPKRLKELNPEADVEK